MNDFDDNFDSESKSNFSNNQLSDNNINFEDLHQRFNDIREPNPISENT